MVNYPNKGSGSGPNMFQRSYDTSSKSTNFIGHKKKSVAAKETQRMIPTNDVDEIRKHGNNGMV